MPKSQVIPTDLTTCCMYDGRINRGCIYGSKETSDPRSSTISNSTISNMGSISNKTIIGSAISNPFFESKLDNNVLLMFVIMF